jgi:hypothetical protein
LKGSKELRESTPALPCEVSSPGACWSTKVTRQPLACKAKAHETPTMPAPSTVTCRLVSKRFMVLFCLKSFWVNFDFQTETLAWAKVDGH